MLVYFNLKSLILCVLIANLKIKKNQFESADSF